MERGGGGRLLTFSIFRTGAYSTWALIRGWALIPINTVISIHTCNYENEGEGRKEKTISKGIFQFRRRGNANSVLSMKQDDMCLQLRPLLQTDSQTQLP